MGLDSSEMGLGKKEWVVFFEGGRVDTQCTLWIMETMCMPGYYHSGSVETHALGQHVPKCINCYKTTVVINGRAHCFHDYIYTYINRYNFFLYLYIKNIFPIFPIPYRTLGWVGLEPTTLSLPCTHYPLSCLAKQWDMLNGLQGQVTTKVKPFLGDCSGWVWIILAANFLYFLYFCPCSQLILGQAISHYTNILNLFFELIMGV